MTELDIEIATLDVLAGVSQTSTSATATPIEITTAEVIDGITQTSTAVTITTIEGGLGPQGPPGPAGTLGGSYHHVQATVSDEWPIQHDLGYNPAGVAVRDTAGTAWEGDVTYDDLNHLTIRFTNPFAGLVDLS